MRWMAVPLAAMIAALCWGVWVMLADSCPPEACDSGETVPLSVPLPVDFARWTISHHRPVELPKGAPDSPDIVKRFARDDIWVFSVSHGGLKAARWDGKRWLKSTPPLPEDLQIEDVAGTDSDDIWISGWSTRLGAPGDQTSPDGTLVHWDGDRWERIPVAANTINLAAVARNDVWALFDGEIMHWDGRTWTPASTPEVPMPDSLDGEGPGSLLTDITALAADDVWAVGAVATYFCCDQRVYHRDVVMHWNGHVWNLFDLGLRGLDLRQAIPDGHGGVWIATWHDGEPWAPIMIHYRGGRWSKSTLPRPNNSQRVQATEIKLTDTGKVLVTGIAYTDTDTDLPTTVEYSLST